MEIGLKNKFEKMQKRAIRWVTCNYLPYVGLSGLRPMLGWTMLGTCRRVANLRFFYDIYHGTIPVLRDLYLTPPDLISD